MYLSRNASGTHMPFFFCACHNFSLFTIPVASSSHPPPAADSTHHHQWRHRLLLVVRLSAGCHIFFALHFLSDKRFEPTRMDSNSNSPFRHFESFTLSPGDMAGVVIFTAAFYITLLAVCRTRVFDRKKLAFCLTAVNALLMFCLALIYVSVKYKLGHNLFDYNGGEYSWWTGRDNFSAVALIMFGTANVMDLSLGWVFYREHLYLLTTWVHHFVYIWLVVLVVTGNGYVASLPTPYTPAFMCALLEKLPTFLLALGTIFHVFFKLFSS